MKVPKYPVSLLLELFRSPEEIAKARFKECMTDLGRPVVILAVDVQQRGRIPLYGISPSEFHAEVAEELFSAHQEYPKVVAWFCQRGGASYALDFAKLHVKKLSTSMMRDVVFLAKDLPLWLSEEAHRRGVMGELILRLFSSSEPSDLKRKYASLITSAFEDLQAFDGCLLSLLTRCLEELPNRLQGSKKSRKKKNRGKVAESPSLHWNSTRSTMERAQYCSAALVNLWSQLKGVADPLFTYAECVSLLSSIFEAADSRSQSQIVSTLLKLRLPAQIYVPLLNETLRSGMELSLAATLTVKVIGDKLEASELGEFHAVWRRFLESGRSEESLPGCLYPSLVDLCIAVENYEMACRVANTALHSRVITPTQKRYVKTSCASSEKLIQCAVCNYLFSDLAVEISRHALETRERILPTLRAWDSVTSLDRLASNRDGMEDTISFLPDSQSLRSLLVILSRDNRCMKSESYCLYGLLAAFGPAIVTYAFLYRGPIDLDTDLFESVSRLHDELRKDLTRATRERHENSRAKVGVDNKTTSSKKQSKSQKTKASDSNPKQEFFQGGFLLNQPKEKAKEKAAKSDNGMPVMPSQNNAVQAPTGNISALDEVLDEIPPISSYISESIDLDVTKGEPESISNGPKTNSKKCNKKKNKRKNKK
eukprot:scaffold655_cov162-Amphora_coffeaeformis.AAC.16